MSKDRSRSPSGSKGDIFKTSKVNLARYGKLWANVLSADTLDVVMTVTCKFTSSIKDDYFLHKAGKMISVFKGQDRLIEFLKKYTECNPIKVVYSEGELDLGAK